MTALSLVTHWGPITSGGWTFIEKSGVTASESGVTLKLANGNVYHCPYKLTPNPVIKNKFAASPPTSVDLACSGRTINVWNQRGGSEKLAAAWKTLAAGAPTESAEEAAAFAALAERFRADPGAHVLNEESRAFKVQAETAVREQRTRDAASRFAKALELSPWWAQGRFNLALIYAELELPSLAIAEMDKYLKLVPDAPNARQAQDKIYEWRDKISK